MKTVTQYKEDIKVLMDKVASMDAKAVAENRDLIDAELNVKNEMLDTVEEYRKIVVTLERQQRIHDSLEKPEVPLTVARTGKIISAQEKRDRFGSFGEQMSAVMNAGLPNGVVDPRLRIHAAAGSGLSESVPSDGGLI